MKKEFAFCGYISGVALTLLTSAFQRCCPQLRDDADTRYYSIAAWPTAGHSDTARSADAGTPHVRHAHSSARGFAVVLCYGGCYAAGHCCFARFNSKVVLFQSSDEVLSVVRPGSLTDLLRSCYAGNQRKKRLVFA
jgi:hypothetical protein